jgi:hypothetical protein
MDAPDPELLAVFESNDTFALALAKGTLDEAGISFWFDGDESSARFGLGPIMFPVCRLSVRLADAAEARALLDPLYPR